MIGMARHKFGHDGSYSSLFRIGAIASAASLDTPAILVHSSQETEHETRMNFDFTDEQKLFADAVRKFAVAHLEKGGALARAHDPRFPFDVAALMSRPGLLGVTLAEADGGQGGTLMDAGSCDRAGGARPVRAAPTRLVQSGSFGPDPGTFAEYASPALKAKYLPALLEGHASDESGHVRAGRRLGGHRSCDHGADRRRPGDRQRHKGVLDLQRADAAGVLIYARFGPGVRGIGSVIVERGVPGFDIGKPSRFMSGEEWCELHFEDCRIPARERPCSAPAVSRRSADRRLQRRAHR